MYKNTQNSITIYITSYWFSIPDGVYKIIFTQKGMSVLTEMLYIDWDSDRTNYLNSKDPRDFIDVLKVILD